MAAELDKLAQYYREKQNTPRADFYTALAAEERANKTPESFSEDLAFSEGAIRLPDLTIGGIKPKEFGIVLASEGYRVSDYASDLLKNHNFTTLPDKQTISLVKTTASAMGLTRNPTTDQIYEKANELGWDLCPAEVGPHLRLEYTDQPVNERLYIGMKQITVRCFFPSVFEVTRQAGYSWLDARSINPTERLDPKTRWVFSPRK